MRVGVIQSSFIPWRGYFDFIASVDVFVFYDDVQYTKGDWRNRNKIKTAKGTEWLTVPVSHQKLSQLILNTPIDHRRSWGKKHLKTWKANYQAAPYFEDVMNILSDLDTIKEPTISQLNIKLIRRICEYLDISTKILISKDITLEGKKTDRLIKLLTSLNATTYLSGPSADAYLDKELFIKSGIRLEYKSYNYAPYPQLWGEFNGAVTILDLVANCGKRSKDFIRSLTKDIAVIL